MQIQLTSRDGVYYIHTENHRECIPKEEGEEDIEYTNRAFQQFESYVKAKENLNKKYKGEVLKTIII